MAERKKEEDARKRLAERGELFRAAEEKVGLEKQQLAANFRQCAVGLAEGVLVNANATLLLGSCFGRWRQAALMANAARWAENARWVDAGQYVTSSGVSAGTDMALAVIERLFGAERAEMVARFTEYQRHTDADVDPFAAYLNQADPAMLG